MRHCRDVTGKVIYVVRDPRALIATSVRSSPVKDDPARIAKTMIARLSPVDQSTEGHGSWPEHVREWTVPDRVHQHFPNVDGVCAVRYDDLSDDPAAGLCQFIEFLGIFGPVDHDRVRRTVETWTAERLRDTVLAEGPPGIAAFRDIRPPRREKAEQKVPSLLEIGEDVEAAYQQRIQEDQELADFVKQFGYES